VDASSAPGHVAWVPLLAPPVAVGGNRLDHKRCETGDAGNVGGAPLTITGITMVVETRRFAVPSYTCRSRPPPGPGKNCTINVTFRPRRRSAKELVVVVDNTPSSHIVILTGLGTQ